MKNRRLLTPKGMRDYLPREAAWRRLVEDKVHRVFTSYGYQEVVTPTLEHMALFAAGNNDDEQSYRFVYREGEVLALRTDMTTPIARLVVSRLREAPLPLRLCYFGNLFRYESPQAGRQREFTQAGVELLGVDGPAADAEVVMLACRALEAAGVQDFHIDIGHVGIVNRLLSRAALLKTTEEAIKEALVQKDLVVLERLVQQNIADEGLKKALTGLSECRGGLVVLEKAAELLQDDRDPALANLAEVYRRLELAGLERYITIDLGLVKAMNYYTGMVMEGYTRELGYDLCSGGRYDRLLGEFGYDLPATGFAMSVDRLLLVLERQGCLGCQQPVGFWVRFPQTVQSWQLDLVEKWRRAGAVIMNDLGMAVDGPTIEFLPSGKVAWHSGDTRLELDPAQVETRLFPGTGGV